MDGPGYRVSFTRVVEVLGQMPFDTPCRSVCATSHERTSSQLSGHNRSYRFHRWHPHNRGKCAPGDQDLSHSQRRRTLFQDAGYIGIRTRIVDDIRIADSLASYRIGERGGAVAFSCAHCHEISLRFASHEGLTGWKNAGQARQDDQIFSECSKRDFRTIKGHLDHCAASLTSSHGRAWS